MTHNLTPRHAEPWTPCADPAHTAHRLKAHAIEAYQRGHDYKRRLARAKLRELHETQDASEVRVGRGGRDRHRGHPARDPSPIR